MRKSGSSGGHDPAPMCADPPQRTWEPDNHTRRPTEKPAIPPKTGPRPAKVPLSHVQHRRRPEKTDTIPGRGGRRELLSRAAAVRIRRATPMSSIPPRRAADESRRRTLSAPDAPATDPPSTGRVSDTEDKYCLRSTDTPHPRRDRSSSASRSVRFRVEIGPVCPVGAAVLRKIASRSRVAVRGLCQGLNGLPRGATGTAGSTRPIAPRGVVPSCAESRLRPSGCTLKIRPRCLRHDRGGPQKRGTARDHSPGWVIPGRCLRAVRIAPPNVNDG